MTFCPYCGVRQDVDLRQIHFRDLGADGSRPCPECQTALTTVEFDTTPPAQIERCGTCHGLFFNPGELEFLLEQKTNPFVWIDQAQIDQIGEDFGHHHEIVYRKCPICAERMSHVNFASRSGVILDQCGSHGYWVDGGELRRLLEWWRAGGKHIHQEAEAERARRLHAGMDTAPRKFVESKQEPINDGYHPMPSGPERRPIDGFDVSEGIVAVLCGLFGSLID